MHVPSECNTHMHMSQQHLPGCVCARVRLSAPVDCNQPPWLTGCLQRQSCRPEFWWLEICVWFRRLQQALVRLHNQRVRRVWGIHYTDWSRRSALRMAAFDLCRSQWGPIAATRLPSRFPQTAVRHIQLSQQRVRVAQQTIVPAACCTDDHVPDPRTAMFKGLAAPSPYWGPIAAADVPGKGRGLVATRDIQPGELLMSCRPLVFMECDEGDVPSMEALYAL